MASHLFPERLPDDKRRRGGREGGECARRRLGCGGCCGVDAVLWFEFSLPLSARFYAKKEEEK
jgi:hypothetical protein